MGECLLNGIFVTVIIILWKLESPVYCILKTQRTIRYKIINTARIQCILKISLFLDGVLGILFINEL